MAKHLKFIIALLLISIQLIGQERVEVNVSTQRLMNDVYFLASDSLKGRQFPHKGRAIAAEHIAGEFQRIGLKPINESDSPYFQGIPAIVPNWGETHLLVNGKWERSGQRFSFVSNQELNDTLVLPTRFIGEDLDHTLCYGDTMLHIAAKNLEEAMPIVMSLAEGCGAELFAISTTKRAKTERLIYAEQRARLPIYPSGLLGSGTSSPLWLYNYMEGIDYKLNILLLDEELMEDIYDDRTKPLARMVSREARYNPYAGPTVDLKVRSSFRSSTTLGTDHNVIGYIEGTDLKDEVVIVCAHYDHVGFTDTTVFYGADDNASGTAAVMELARMFAQAQVAGVELRRTIVFIAFGAEESGLNGSYYYVANPLFPLEQTVLVVNMDMVGRADVPPNAKGYAYTIPIKGNKRPMRRLLRTIDRQLNDIYFIKRVSGVDRLTWHFGSDHYPFIREGVPALVVNTGLHADYHQPTDTPDRINYHNMTNIVRAMFAAITHVANDPEKFSR